MTATYKPPAIPQNHLLAVVDDAAALDAINADLNAQGYRSTLLFQKSLREQAAKTDAADVAIEGVENVLSEENEYRDQYQDEADLGHLVLAIPVEHKKEDLAALHPLLERHGARAVRYFGTFAVTDL